MELCSTASLRVTRARARQSVALPATAGEPRAKRPVSSSETAGSGATEASENANGVLVSETSEGSAERRSAGDRREP